MLNVPCQWPEGEGGAPTLEAIEATVQSTAVPVRIDGVQVAWRDVRTPLALPVALARLERGWQRTEAAGGWAVFTRHQGCLLHTLQLRSAGVAGSEGYWSVLDASAPARAPARLPLRLPLGAQLLRTFEQLDAAAPAVQFTGQAGVSASALRLALARAARAAGWQGGGPAALPSFTRAGQQLDLQVVPRAAGAGFLITVRPGGQGGQGGQVLVEYVLVLSTVVLALFVPLFDGRSVAGALANAWRDLWASASFLISLS